MPALYALTLVVSAALLFAVQPMVARMALPVLGGAPAVWNTCIVFFQATVLGGYFLAHLISRRLCLRTQVGVYLVLIVVGSIGLPMVVDMDPGSTPSEPLSWLFKQLSAEVALPALALATASPLLQSWFALGERGGREPFFLYAASNIGSLGALLAYPAVVEPSLALNVQTRAWTLAYGVWGLLVLICAAAALRAAAQSVRRDDFHVSATIETVGNPISVFQWARWAALGAVPAGLLQGCTLFLTTDLASVPLLWVIPLALYLLSFVLAFSRGGGLAVRIANRVLPFLAVSLLLAILTRATQPVLLLLALHLAFLFAAGLVCHGRLVALRPTSRDLTTFYLALAAGGVLGGAFCVLLAPRLFTSVAEYPIAIALACAFLTPRSFRKAMSASKSELGPGLEKATSAATWVRDIALALAVAMVMVAAGLVVPWLVTNALRWRDALVFGIPAVACCAALDRPRRLALSVGAAFMAGLWLQGLWTHTERAERNFFGITRVTVDAERRFRQLVHGNTIHGRQFQDPAHRNEPLTYYHRRGPLGSIFEALSDRGASHGHLSASGNDAAWTRQIGVIGLGIGSMSAYAGADEAWTFYEIDPAVIRVARDPQWFTFLSDSRAGRLRVVEGDARLRLAEEKDGTLDLLVLDAFSSDSIPVHLLTREALALYWRKLRPDGWLAAHISNRYLQLEPVFAALARDGGFVCRTVDDTDENDAPGKEPSHWVILARDSRGLKALMRHRPWVPAEGADLVPTWTDQRTAILPIFEWR